MVSDILFGLRPQTYSVLSKSSTAVRKLPGLFYFTTHHLKPRTTRFTFTNPTTFCSHGVLMCCVRISAQTAIISLHNIN
jgi:hypothetical protein